MASPPTMMALPTPTEIPADLLASASRLHLKRRVTFMAATENEVIAIERVDNTLVHDLFYSSDDYRKFRRDNRRHTRRLLAKANNNSDASTTTGHYSSSPKSALFRRERFQSMVAQRVYEQQKQQASTVGLSTPRSPLNQQRRRVQRACEISTLRNMRLTATAVLSSASSQ